MSGVLKVARFAANVIGKDKSKAVEKYIGTEIRSLIGGLPKGEKAKFLRTYESFLRNPQNENLQQSLYSLLERNPNIARRAKACNEEYIANLSRRCTQGSNPTSTEWADSFARRVIGDSSARMYKFDAVSTAKDHLVYPFVGHSACVRGLKTLNETLPQTIQQTLSESLKQFVHISPEQSGKIVEDVIKEQIKDARTSLFRLIGYPFSKTASLFVNKEAKVLLKDVLTEPKWSCGKKYYTKLVKTKGLEDSAPQKITVLQEEAKPTIWELYGGKSKHSCQGGFSPSTNTISFTREFTQLPRYMQIQLVTHELQHFEQVETVIRTFGINRYIEALKTQGVMTLKVQKQFANKTEKELRQIVEDEWSKNGLAEKVKTAFEKSSQKEKIDINSELGKRAKTYLNGLENYTGIGNGFLLEASKAYINNPLEVGAYKEGNKMGLRAWILEQLHIV